MYLIAKKFKIKPSEAKEENINDLEALLYIDSLVEEKKAKEAKIQQDKIKRMKGKYGR